MKSLFSFLIAAAWALSALAHAQTMTAWVGSTTRGFQNGSGTTARFDWARGMDTDADGNILVADYLNHCIRKITPAGDVSVFAGAGGLAGFVDHTSATSARFKNPSDLVVAPDGTIYVADEGNHCVRKISTTGQVTTLAGIGTPGYATGTGATARFDKPSGIALGNDGMLYVCDYFNHMIRRVDPGTGATTDAAGDGTGWTIDGNGTSASLYQPYFIRKGSDGSLYFTEFFAATVRKFNPNTGAVTTLAGKDANGDVERYGYTDGVGTEARFSNSIQGLAVGPGDTVYVADYANHCIRKVAPDGKTSTWFGGGVDELVTGPLATARLGRPTHLLMKPGLTIVAYFGAQMLKIENTAALNAGTIGNGQTICIGQNPAAFSSTAAASGGTGTLVYTWQSAPADNGPWTNLTSSNAATYDVPTVSNAGTVYYRRRVMDNNGTGASAFSNIVNITALANPTANAGTDQSICGTTATLSPTATNGTGTWSIISQPTGGNAALSGNSISGLTVSGTYTFRYTVSNGACANATDEVMVTKVGNPTANAGTDQSICGTIATLSPTATNGTGTWTLVGHPNGASPAISGNNVSGLTTPGSYTLRYTVSNGVCTNATDEVVVTKVGNPSANAGTDQSICGTAATLSPTATNGTGTWSIISQPNGASPALSGNNVSGLTVSGAYTFRYTVSNGACADAQDEVTITKQATRQGSTEVHICGNETPYIWHGTSYNGAGTYQKQLVTAGGCDSVATLILHVHTVYSYFLGIDLTPDQLPYQFGPHSITQSGTYTHTFESVHGCDSLVQLGVAVVEPNSRAGKATIKVSAYPNPAKSVLHLQMAASGPLVLRLTDLLGRTLHTEALPAGTTHHSVQIGHMAAGVYMLEVQSSEGTRSLRIVKED